MKLLLIAGAVLFSIPALAQTRKIDQLKTQVWRAVTPSQKLTALLALCAEGSSMNIDTLYRYAIMAKQAAQANGDKTSIATADIAVETWLELKGFFDSALTLCDKNLAGLKYLSPWDIYARQSMKKCYILVKSNRRKEGLDMAFRFLGEAEKKEDTVSQVYCKYLIGCVYRNMQQTEPAYFLTGMMYNWKVFADTLQKDITRDSLLAVHYLNLAIVYSRRYENMPMLARALGIMCDQTEGPEHADFAGACMKEAIKIYNQLGDTVSILNGITVLSNFYVSMHQPEKGVEACIKGLEMAKRGNGFPVQDMYWTLGACYKAAGRYEEYAKTLRTIIELKDTIYKRNSENDLAALNAKYEDVKKENTIIQQKYDITRKNYLFYGSLVLLALAGIVFYLLFKEYRRKQIIKVEQIQAEEKLLAQMAVTAAEENQRKRIAADLHDNLGSQANAILYGTELLLQEPGKKDMLLNDLHDTAKDMLLSLRETLWAMKTTEVSVIDVWLRVISFSMQMNRYYRHMVIATSGKGEEGLELSAAKALHVILIIQEAVNNAVRHAEATNVMINSAFEAGIWIIKVSDNGKGFNYMESQKKDGHYGLANMRERALAANLVFKIETAPMQGTVVWLTIPVAVRAA
jgi:signal transduction histidine kinase